MYDVPSLRTHLVHNIDDRQGYAAVRKESWKLVKGNSFLYYSFSTCKFHLSFNQAQLTMETGTNGMGPREEKMTHHRIPLAAKIIILYMRQRYNADLNFTFNVSDWDSGFKSSKRVELRAPWQKLV